MRSGTGRQEGCPWTVRPSQTARGREGRVQGIRMLHSHPVGRRWLCREGRRWRERGQRSWARVLFLPPGDTISRCCSPGKKKRPRAKLRLHYAEPGGKKSGWAEPDRGGRWCGHRRRAAAAASDPISYFTYTPAPDLRGATAGTRRARPAGCGHDRRTWRRA